MPATTQRVTPAFDTRQLRECKACAHQAIVDDVAGTRGLYSAAISPGELAHVADLVTGRTLCGRNADRWRWVTIAPARPRARARR